MAGTSATSKQETGLRSSRNVDGLSMRSPREAKSNSLRVSGLGVLQDFPCNSSVFSSAVPSAAPKAGPFLDGLDITGRLLNVHNAVASRNVEAAKVLERSDGAGAGDADGRVGSNLPGSPKKGTTLKRSSSGAVRRRAGARASIEDEDPAALIPIEIDSQALAAEFDSVSAALRTLMSDNPSSHQFTMTRQSENDPADEDDNEGEEELKKRILRYRFVRKIEDPPPPLQGLEELPPEKKISSDKIERNKRHTFLAWSLNIKERTLQRNQEQSERATVARQRRQEAETSHQERMAELLAQFESHTNCRSKTGQQVQLSEKAAQRKNHVLEVQQRRQEFEAKRLERIQADLDGKEARVASPRRQGYAAAHLGAPLETVATAQATVGVVPAPSASSARASATAAPPVDAATAGGDAGLTILELFDRDKEECSKLRHGSTSNNNKEDSKAKQKDRIPEEEAAETERAAANASSRDEVPAGPTSGESEAAGVKDAAIATTALE